MIKNAVIVLAFFVLVKHVFAIGGQPPTVGSSSEDKYKPDYFDTDLRRQSEQSMPSAGGDSLFYRDLKNSRVGILVKSPAYTLDVNGTINSSFGVQGATGTFTTLTSTTETVTQVNVTSVTLNGLKFAGNPVGTVIMYGGASAPSGWLLCDGSSISTTTYTRLFSVLGTTFGGSGANFNVPDFRGVFPKGAGTTNRAAGVDASGNSYAGTLGAFSQDKMQGHLHSQTWTSAGGAAQNLGSGAANATNTQSPAINTTGPVSDGTNGTPRTGHTTEPQSLGITFIIYAGI